MSRENFNVRDLLINAWTHIAQPSACIVFQFDGPPTSDAVPASLVDGTPGDLKADLITLLGKENVLHRAIDLVRYASDASPYRLVPQVVVLPRTTDDRSEGAISKHEPFDFKPKR